MVAHERKPSSLGVANDVTGSQKWRQISLEVRLRPIRAPGTCRRFIIQVRLSARNAKQHYDIVLRCADRRYRDIQLMVDAHFLFPVIGHILITLRPRAGVWRSKKQGGREDIQPFDPPSLFVKLHGTKLGRSVMLPFIYPLWW